MTAGRPLGWPAARLWIDRCQQHVEYLGHRDHARNKEALYGQDGRIRPPGVIGAIGMIEQVVQAGPVNNLQH